MPILTALLLAAADPVPPATLVVYRNYAEPILFAPTVRIDGHDAGKLGQKRLLAFAVVPGRHRIEIEWPMFSNQRRTLLTVTIEAGARAYVELRAAAGYGRGYGVSALIAQDEPTGAAGIRCCHQDPIREQPSRSAIETPR